VTETAVCTWFVADDAATATFFPQVGSRSDAPETQAIYWRCTACFFASSMAVNPGARHVFFTNTDMPSVDGVDLAALFGQWGVETVTLPITYRLPQAAVGSWGNQFYILDILDHLTDNPIADRTIVLDSDCLWLRGANDGMDAAIEASGALTYLLGEDEHPADASINGLSREGMAQFLRRHGGPNRPAADYCGGEIYAARQDVTRRLSARVRALWPDVLEQGPDAPREEAHLLSILYVLDGIELGTANPFIRRMWTTFRHHNLYTGDRELTLWHLPAEKKTGFGDLFAQVTALPGLNPRHDAEAMGLSFPNYARTMGWPRRRAGKFVRDLGLKVREKVGS
jgi:hypothetical protein